MVQRPIPIPHGRLVAVGPHEDLVGDRGARERDRGRRGARPDVVNREAGGRDRDLDRILVRVVVDLNEQVERTRGHTTREPGQRRVRGTREHLGLVAACARSNVDLIVGRASERFDGRSRRRHGERVVKVIGRNPRHVHRHPRADLARRGRTPGHGKAGPSAEVQARDGVLIGQEIRVRPDEDQRAVTPPTTRGRGNRLAVPPHRGRAPRQSRVRRVVHDPRPGRRRRGVAHAVKPRGLVVATHEHKPIRVARRVNRALHRDHVRVAERRVRRGHGANLEVARRDVAIGEDERARDVGQRRPVPHVGDRDVQAGEGDPVVARRLVQRVVLRDDRHDLAATRGDLQEARVVPADLRDRALEKVALRGRERGEVGQRRRGRILRGLDHGDLRGLELAVVVQEVDPHVPVARRDDLRVPVEGLPGAIRGRGREPSSRGRPNPDLDRGHARTVVLGHKHHTPVRERRGAHGPKALRLRGRPAHRLNVADLSRRIPRGVVGRAAHPLLKRRRAVRIPTTLDLDVDRRGVARRGARAHETHRRAHGGSRRTGEHVPLGCRRLGRPKLRVGEGGEDRVLRARLVARHQVAHPR